MTEAKTSRGSGREWTDDDVRQLRELAAGNTPVGVMSVRLRRSEDAVRSKAEAEGIPLPPTRRPPYGDKSAEAEGISLPPTRRPPYGDKS
ncbi:hypothetical protein [Kribbella sp. CA-294648]|uniref:hypothetical protein n=1 Tax=Kribbella sp. CA-294648 TaxID=3239948 RepID=UPI003D904599